MDDGHWHLQSADHGQLDIPRVRLSTYGGCTDAHSVMPDLQLGTNSTLFLPAFRCQLKHVYFSHY